MPEGLRKASLSLRVMAKALDLLVVAAVISSVPQVGLLAGAAYLLVSDGFFDGRSPGKKIMALRVVPASNGAAAAVKGSMIRNAPFAAGILLLALPLVGWLFIPLVMAFEFLLALGNAEGKRLGDELAGTAVVEG